MTENEIGTVIVDTAVEVHRQLGPGLLESVYEVVLAHELSTRGFSVDRQVPVQIVYKSMTLEEAFRADLLVARKVIIELKSVEILNNTHRKQLQTYLRLTSLKLGYLLNFGAALIKDGIVRAVNNLEDSPLPLRVPAPLRERSPSVSPLRVSARATLKSSPASIPPLSSRPQWRDPSFPLPLRVSAPPREPL